MPFSLLLSGFEPFAGSSINPSAEVVNVLAQETFPGLELHTMVLPVDQELAPPLLLAALERHQPDWCVMLGEARGRATISIERVAINLSDFRIPDNGGHQPQDEPIAADGPAAYFVNLPVRHLAKAVADAGVPVALSLSAGSFMCNYVLYTALHHCSRMGLGTRCGFMHLPVLPCQVEPEQANVPTMELEHMHSGIRAVLQALARAEAYETAALPM